MARNSDGRCEYCAVFCESEGSYILHKCDPHDPVSRPAHYTRGKVEVIDFIEDQQLGYHLGQVIKYVCRAGHKDASTRKQDLEKARWYLSREIDRCAS
jgi:hypothetical protein